MATQALAGPVQKITPSGANLSTAGTAFGAGDSVTIPNDGRSAAVFIVSATGGTATLKGSGSIPTPAGDIAITLTASSVVVVGPFSAAYGPLVTIVTATATGSVKALALPYGQRNLAPNAFEADSTQLDSI